MTIVAPSDFAELRMMLRYAVKIHTGPIAIRYPRGGGSEELYKHEEFVPGKAEIVRQGEFASVIAIGNMLEVALNLDDNLAKEGKNCDVINCRSIKPIDKKSLIESIEKTNRVVILEDHGEVGGLASVVIQLISETKLNPEILTFAYPDECIIHGNKNEVSKRYCMDFESIYQKINSTWG